MAKFKLVFWQGDGGLVDAADPQQVILSEDNGMVPGTDLLRAMCRAAEAGKLKGGWQLYRIES